VVERRVLGIAHKIDGAKPEGAPATNGACNGNGHGDPAAGAAE
jgi:hypothetical protein